MTSSFAPAGRGRGRGRGAYFDRRPGSSTDTVPSEKNSLEQLSALVKALKVSPVDVNSVTSSIQKYGTSEEHQQEAVRAVYGCCKDSWKNAGTATDICNKLVKTENVGVKYRAAMVQILQKDFKVKEELRKADPAQFLGCLSFLCQVVSKLRTPSGEPYFALFKPCIEALGLLLAPEASEEDVTCAAYQLLCVGQSLDERESEAFQKVLPLAKDVILDCRCSRQCREQLLSVVEASASNWKIAPAKPPSL